jgi:hypothetical protein
VDELMSLRDEGFIKFVPDKYGSPVLKPTHSADGLHERYGAILERYRGRISFLIDKLVSTGMENIDDLTIALYFATECKTGTSQHERARSHLRRILGGTSGIEPHVGADRVLSVSERGDELIEEADGVIFQGE